MNFSKLSHREFFSVYAISLLEMNNMVDKTELLVYLLPIAEKYLFITNKAIRHELKHTNSCGRYTYSKTKRKKWYIPNLKKFCRECSLEDALKIFHRDSWAEEYGGIAWAEITKEAINLKKAVEQENLKKIILYIDRLNDLEHNTNLYLEEFCNFNLGWALNYKFEASIHEIISNSSRELIKIYSKMGKDLL